MKNGARVYFRDNKGQTPLHIATKKTVIVMLFVLMITKTHDDDPKKKKLKKNILLLIAEISMDKQTPLHIGVLE